MLARIAAAAALAALLAGCREQSQATSLQLVATNPSVGRATFALECGPAGGDVPRPAEACAALARDPNVLLRPRPFVCWGGTFSWWAITISGRYGGRPVDVRTRSCWTPQMRLIRVLGIGAALDRHIEPLSRRAHVAVLS